LQTDGYEGYTALGAEPGSVHVGCWAHTRRKFDEALRGQGKSKKKGSKRTAKQSRARQALSQIQALYRIERELRDASPAERHAARQTRSKPLIEKLREWLDASIDSVPPQSLTGNALHYMNGQWPKLVRVLYDGRIPLDTNLVENAIPPFVIGRKNWLFADTVAGARASANLYGLIETAKANAIEPSRYLAYLFEILPTVTSAEQLDALLPRISIPTRSTPPQRGCGSSSAYGWGEPGLTLREATKCGSNYPYSQGEGEAPGPPSAASTCSVLLAGAATQGRAAPLAGERLWPARARISSQRQRGRSPCS
jgi:hypothetical protein